MSKAYWMFKYAGEYQIKILTVWGKGAARGGFKGLKTPLSNQNIDVYFLSYSPTL